MSDAFTLAIFVFLLTFEGGGGVQWKKSSKHESIP